jgi:sugar phosphate isomerase/epimerase
MINLQTRLESVAVALMALALLVPSAIAENKIPDECKAGGFAIGCIAYTCDKFTLFEALEKTAETGGKVVELCAKTKLSKEEPGVAFDYHALPETVQKVKDKLAQCKLKAVTFAVIPFPATESEARKLFEFVKTMGIRAIVTEPAEPMDLIEKLVKEYDVMVGFHNHPRQPNNPAYRMWDPNYVLAAIKDRDPRIGCCADTGHWLRSNLKPVDCLRLLRGRIVCFHLKDLNEMGPAAHDVPYGTGVADLPGILDELRAQHFQGSLSIEYEYHWENSAPEVAQCVGFVRGYGAARGWRGPGEGL